MKKQKTIEEEITEEIEQVINDLGTDAIYGYTDCQPNFDKMRTRLRVFSKDLLRLFLDNIEDHYWDILGQSRFKD